MAFRQKDLRPDPEPGLTGEFRAFLNETSAHLRTRGELFGIEAREAAASYSRKFALAALGFATLAVAYLLILSAIIGLLGSLFSGAGLSLANWIGAALILAALHLIIAFVALQKSRKAGKEAAHFEHTLAELRKDQQWLNHKKNN